MCVMNGIVRETKGPNLDPDINFQEIFLKIFYKPIISYFFRTDVRFFKTIIFILFLELMCEVNIIVIHVFVCMIHQQESTLYSYILETDLV